MEMNGQTRMPLMNHNPEHRFGTELSLIFAYCHKLRETVDKPLSQMQALILTRIEQSAENIRALRAEIWNDAEKRTPIPQIVEK
jgi:hypothetical protein